MGNVERLLRAAQKVLAFYADSNSTNAEEQKAYYDLNLACYNVHEESDSLTEHRAWAKQVREELGIPEYEAAEARARAYLKTYYPNDWNGARLDALTRTLLDRRTELPLQGLDEAAQLIFQMSEFYQHKPDALRALEDVRRAILVRAGRDPNTQGSAQPLDPATLKSSADSSLEKLLRLARIRLPRTTVESLQEQVEWFMTEAFTHGQAKKTSTTEDDEAYVTLLERHTLYLENIELRKLLSELFPYIETSISAELYNKIKTTLKLNTIKTSFGTQTTSISEGRLDGKASESTGPGNLASAGSTPAPSTDKNPCSRCGKMVPWKAESILCADCFKGEYLDGAEAWCDKCGAPHETVRPGKTQPTCQCDDEEIP